MSTCHRPKPQNQRFAKIGVLAMLFFLSGIAQAQISSGGGKANWYGLSASLGAGPTLTIASDQGGRLGSRYVNGAGATLTIDYTVPKLNMTLGGHADYIFLQQSSDPSGFADTNLSGRCLTGGALITVRMGWLRISGQYDLYGQYDLSQKDSQGLSVRFKDATGYGGAVAFQWKTWLDFEIAYSQKAFQTATVGTQAYEIKSTPLTLTSFFLITRLRLGGV